MTYNVDVCPKCGYRHGNDTEIHHTCPACGIVYKKYFERMAALKEINTEPDTQVTASVPSRNLRLSPAMIVVTVIVLIVAGVLFIFTGRNKQQLATSQTNATEKIIRAFPYDIKGTYKANLTFERNGPNNTKIPDEFEAHLTVDNWHHVSDVKWSDRGSFSGPVRMSWSYPDMQQLVSEISEHKSTDHQRTQFSIGRSGHALSLDLDESRGGNIVLDWKNAFSTPFAGTDKNGIFEYVKELDAIRASIKVIITPNGDLNVPLSAITTFNGKGHWFIRCVDPLLRAGGQSVFQDISCRDIAVLTGANVITLKLRHVDVPSVASIQLTKESQIFFSMGGERNMEVLFFRDGRKKLINREGVYGKSIEFDLVQE